MIGFLRMLLMRTLAAVAVVAAGLVGTVAVSTQSKAYTEQFGVYGTRWADWVELNHRLAGFYVYQAPRVMRPKDFETIEKIAATGIEIMAMQKVYPSATERFMRNNAKPDRPVAEVADAFARNYAHPATASIQIITLDEENFWWNRRDRYLADLYTAVKPRVGGRQVWQWFNDNPRRRRAPIEDRFLIPADGYMIDMYSVPVTEYEDMLLGYVRQGKPIVSVLWASSTWFHGGRHEGRQMTWWNEEGWRNFFAKTLINRRYGVRTALFMYDIPYNKPGSNLTPSFNSDDPCVRAFVKKMFTETLPQLGTIPISSPVPAVRPAWMAERCPI